MAPDQGSRDQSTDEESIDIYPDYPTKQNCVPDHHSQGSVAGSLHLLKTSTQDDRTLNPSRLPASFLFLLWRRRRWDFELLGFHIHTMTDLLPGALGSLEVPEGLGELKGFGDNPFLLFVVADFGVSSEWEVLSERVALETVVCEDPSEVRVSREEDSIKIPGLSFVPVGTPVDRSGTRYGRHLIRIGFDPDPTLILYAQKVINDLEPLLSGRIIDTIDRDQTLVLSAGMVPEERQDGDDSGGRDVEREFVLVRRDSLDIFWESGEDIGTVGRQGRVDFGVF